MTTRILALATCVLGLAACDDGELISNPDEVITTVTLTFTPMGGGTPVTASFDDPDGDGGNAPTIDSIALPAGAFTLAVELLNALETPAENITEEVADESDQHQIFLTGTAVDGPATSNPGAPLMHGYTDSDVNGFPIGLASSVAARSGTGDLTLTLKHLPPLDGSPLKTADLAAGVKANGISSIPGDTDVSVTFPVSVP
ncbi:MAG: hypothetical protein WKG01_00695 [Kofleriaceae bacterium]